MSSPLPPLIAHLAAQWPGAYVVETHISWVILAGEYAYKLKKPLALGFLDFSTLERRRHFCAEEIRLNRRLAPDIYLETLPVTGTEDRPVLGGGGPPLEWAVKMRAFDPRATLDRAARLLPEQVDAIADRIAEFHQNAAPAPGASAHGMPEAVAAPVRQNFSQIRALEPPAPVAAALAPLETWAEAEGVRLVPFFARRKAEGFIRECHGDLHLGNIAWHQDAPLLFDGIEFNPDLRFIDVMNEVAFLVMDLRHRGHDRLAWRALNRYLEGTGDYDGLAALPYYLMYRALVRAKVAAIRTRQEGGDFSECGDYLALAARVIQPAPSALILMHGVSGSGKTRLSQWLLEDLGSVRLRSDVERKRLFGLAPLASSAAIPGGIYTPEAGTRTRTRLLQLAATLLGQGQRVIVDATFIARDWRDAFTALARDAGAPWCWVSPQVPEAELRARVAARSAGGRDASEAGLAVLEDQLASQEPLSAGERSLCLAPGPDWPRERLALAAASLLRIPYTATETP